VNPWRLEVRLEAAGIEPASKPAQDKVQKRLAGEGQKSFAQTFAREIENYPDLTRIVAAWPELPEAIRRAMLALVESALGRP